MNMLTVCESTSSLNFLSRLESQIIQINILKASSSSLESCFVSSIVSLVYRLLSLARAEERVCHDIIAIFFVFVRVGKGAVSSFVLVELLMVVSKLIKGESED
eukprot:186508_1